MSHVSGKSGVSCLRGVSLRRSVSRLSVVRRLCLNTGNMLFGVFFTSGGADFRCFRRVLCLGWPGLVIVRGHFLAFLRFRS